MATKSLNIPSLLFDANPLVGNKTGVGYYLEGLISALAKNKSNELHLTGHYFNFLGKNPTVHLPASPPVSYITSKFFHLRLLGLLRLVGLQLPYELFTRRRADIVFFSNFVSMPTLTRNLNVLAIYDLCFFDCPQYVADRNGVFLRKLVPKSIKRADVIVTISDFTKQRIVDLFKVAPERIYVTPVPPLPPADANYTVYDRFHIKKDYVLFVGTLEPRKNLNTLLSAYERLPETIQRQYPLVLVGGKGWKDNEIAAQIEKLRAEGKKVVTTGYVSEAEKSALYKGATLCVQPSHYEGFGMPILEAMSYGKPVVCSNIPVFKEIAGTSAAFFDKDSPDDLAQTIMTLLANQQKLVTLEEKSKKLAANIPTWDQVTDGLYNFLIGRLHT